MYMRVVHPPPAAPSIYYFTQVRVYVISCYIKLVHLYIYIYIYVGKFLCRAISLNVFSSKILLTRYRKYIIQPCDSFFSLVKLQFLLYFKDLLIRCCVCVNDTS